MRTVDPNFAGLSLKDQGTVIYHAQRKLNPVPETLAGPEDKGFLTTLGLDIYHLPVSLLRFANPMTAGPDAAAGMREMGGKAVEAFKQGDPLGAFGYGTAAAIPFIGPAAAQAGEEFQQGQTGQAAAHTLELLAPFMRGAAPRAARGVKGAAAGVKAELPNVPKWSKRGATVGGLLGGGGGYGAALHGIEAGGVAGGAFPLVRGAVKGGIKGLLESPPPTLIPRSIPPVWQGVTSPEAAALPDLSPIQSGGLPSGRKVGPAPPGPPPPTPAGIGRTPVWQGIEPVSPSPTVFEPEAAKVSRTGRKPGPAPPAPRAQRTPVWQGIEPPAPLPDLTTAKPIRAKSVDLSSSLETPPLPPISPVQPTASAAETVRGVHYPEVPSHYVSEPNPTAAFKNDQAIVAELRKVPGITQGTLTPEMVHEVRKALGQRKLKESDVERRVGHIRQLLPK